MIVVEYKIKAHQYQYNAIDKAIRIGQFIRNKALRFWMDGHAQNGEDRDVNAAKNILNKAKGMVGQTKTVLGESKKNA